MSGRRSEGDTFSAYDVVVVGGGPVGLMLACERALRDVAPSVASAWRQVMPASERKHTREPSARFKSGSP